MGRFKHGLSAGEQQVLHDTASLALQLVADDWLGGEHVGKGVYFRIAIFGESSDSPIFAQVFMQWIGGSFNKDREGLFCANSAEKLLRLFHHFEVGHRSSFQSRTEGLNYAGAIRFRALIPSLGDGNMVQIAFSASGLPEFGDEAMCVELADLMGQHKHWSIVEKDLQTILGISRNPVYDGRLSPLPPE